MPVVTIDPKVAERFELKTAPADPEDTNDENGWVLLRPLPYGMKLKRRDGMSKMSMRSQGEDGEIELQSFNDWAVGFDFGYCIVDHNLTDSNKQKLDFSKPLSRNLLDPKVGSEIEKLINSLNEDPSEESMEDFLKRSNTSSTTESTDSSNSELSSETKTETP
jgi:hypothetical protein